MFLNTGVLVTKILVDSINAANIIIKYYDTVGNELFQEAIDKKAKEKAHEIMQGYLDQAAKTGRLDPRLIQKAEDAFRAKMQ